MILDDNTILSTKLLIAADGANSPIRTELGIEATEESYSQSAVVANWICTYPHLETAFQWFLPGGDIVAMLPLRRLTARACSAADVRAAEAAEVTRSKPLSIVIEPPWLGRCVRCQWLLPQGRPRHSR